ncbi:MFS transporter [Marisediminicola senii]|uniref:MFS transporter n=1 Tax=Marisediminicola senii TaxID=2711233 RepID=UPI001F4158A5|nr:MFS transporter [Marisediminicola senii]
MSSPASTRSRTTDPEVPALSATRQRLALLALALGGFGIGATEFVAMGLLPDLAANLLPTLYEQSPEEGIARAGWLISAYALGVVVGAPTIAAGAARFPRKSLLLVLTAAFTIATVASALLPTFETVLAARFIAGLPHGAYFGIASLVAGQLMGPGNRGKGIALVLSGLTIANVIGVPSITWLGQVAGWRAAYLVVAAIFAATFVAIALVVPLIAGDPSASVKRELSAFRRPQVWIAIGLGSIGFGGFFAVYAYIAPVVTDVVGMGEGFVPWVLVTVGIGMTIGNLLGGRMADRSVRLTLYSGFGLLVLSLVGFALTGGTVVGVLVFGFAIGFTSAYLSPGIQARLMDVAGDSQTIAAALNHSALNLGNSLGALLGGLTIAAGLGYLSPAWLGVGLATTGCIIATISYGLQRRGGRMAPTR